MNRWSASCCAAVLVLSICSSAIADSIVDAVNSHDLKRVAEELRRNPAEVNLRVRDQSNGMTPLHLAALNRDIATMTLLLDSGANAELTDNDGLTPLQVASEFDRTEAANLLIARGTHVDTSSAVMLNRIDLVRQALKADPQTINARSHYQRRPLQWAARMNYKDIVALLLDSGADPNLQDINGFTPLRDCVWADYIETAKLLLTHGADPNIADRTGVTPLHQVVYGIDPRIKVELASLLLAHGASVNARDAAGRTPLFDGIHDVEIARLMLGHGADPNAVSASGMTPLGTGKSEDQMQLLLDHGANMRFVGPHGITPLHFIAGSGNLALVQLALAHGANPRAKTMDGFTPLHAAAQSGSLPIVELLIQHGARVNAVQLLANIRTQVSGVGNNQTEVSRTGLAGDQKISKNGGFTVTPLRAAAIEEHVEVAQYLLEHGAKPDVFASVLLGNTKSLKQLIDRDRSCVNLSAPNRMTPLLLAVERGDEDMVRLLLESGADKNAPAPQLYAGSAADLAHYQHHDNISALIRTWDPPPSPPTGR